RLLVRIRGSTQPCVALEELLAGFLVEGGSIVLHGRKEEVIFLSEGLYRQPRKVKPAGGPLELLHEGELGRAVGDVEDQLSRWSLQGATRLNDHLSQRVGEPVEELTGDVFTVLGDQPVGSCLDGVERRDMQIEGVVV